MPYDAGRDSLAAQIFAYYSVFDLFYDVERVPFEDYQRVTSVGSPQRRRFTFLPEPTQEPFTFFGAANGFLEPDFAMSRAK
jgi:hypothetical protein